MNTGAGSAWYYELVSREIGNDGTSATQQIREIDRKVHPFHNLVIYDRSASPGHLYWPHLSFVKIRTVRWWNYT
jgi:hypothetical protein